MTRMGCKEMAGRHRLALLGGVFSAEDLRKRFSWSRETSRVTLHRWHHRDGLIRPLGGRSEVYFNLLVEPNWHAHFETAVKRAIPQTITIGQSAYSNGWINQPPNARHLAVPSSAQLYGIEGCQFHVRRPDWFQAVAAGHVQTRRLTIPELRPGWALADSLFAKAAYRNGDLRTPRTTDGQAGAHSWVPDPDELYADDCTTEDVRDFTDAVEHLKAYYGFPTLLVNAFQLNMRLAYAAAHSFILGAVYGEHSPAPGL